jgi:hypothetical protein
MRPRSGPDSPGEPRPAWGTLDPAARPGLQVAHPHPQIFRVQLRRQEQPEDLGRLVAHHDVVVPGEPHPALQAGQGCRRLARPSRCGEQDGARMLAHGGAVRHHRSDRLRPPSPDGAKRRRRFPGRHPASPPDATDSGPRLAVPPHSQPVGTRHRRPEATSQEGRHQVRSIPRSRVPRGVRKRRHRTSPHRRVPDPDGQSGSILTRVRERESRCEGVDEVGPGEVEPRCAAGQREPSACHLQMGRRLPIPRVECDEHRLGPVCRAHARARPYSPGPGGAGQPASHIVDRVEEEKILKDR